jgi:hypothetical protein
MTPSAVLCLVERLIGRGEVHPEGYRGFTITQRGGSPGAVPFCSEGGVPLAAENRTMMSDVTISPPPVTDPDPSVMEAPGLVGPCASCQRPTHK